MKDEIRHIAASELRVIDGAEGAPPKITGYAAVFNSLSQDLGGFRERILPGAFRDVLHRGDEILALMHHDPKMLLGRRSKGTLELTEDDRGLLVTISPPNTSIGRDAVENVKRGDIQGMSFSFQKPKDSWTKDGRDVTRTIHTFGAVREVTLTPIPAYTETSAEVRQQIEQLTKVSTPDRDRLLMRLRTI